MRVALIKIFHRVTYIYINIYMDFVAVPKKVSSRPAHDVFLLQATAFSCSNGTRFIELSYRLLLHTSYYNVQLFHSNLAQITILLLGKKKTISTTFLLQFTRSHKFGVIFHLVLTLLSNLKTISCGFLRIYELQSYV